MKERTRTRRLTAVLATIGAATATLACNATICGVTFTAPSRVEMEATSQAVVQALSTIEAEIQPTIEAALTAAPQAIVTAVAAATRTAPTAEAIEAAITPDPFWPQISRHNPSLALDYYEGLVLGIAPETSGATHVEFPDFVRTEVAAALAWTNESYKDLFINGLGFLGLGLGQDSGVLIDDINRASLGAYAFQSREPFPDSADDALRLIRETYPGLDVELVPQVSEPNTFSFESRALLPAIMQEQPTLVPQLVHAGVTYRTERDQMVVWVVVARGSMVSILDGVP